MDTEKKNHMTYIKKKDKTKILERHDYCLCYSGFPNVLEGFNDANLINDLDEMKSTSGYVVTLG